MAPVSSKGFLDSQATIKSTLKCIRDMIRTNSYKPNHICQKDKTHVRCSICKIMFVVFASTLFVCRVYLNLYRLLLPILPALWQGSVIDCVNHTIYVHRIYYSTLWQCLLWNYILWTLQIISFWRRSANTFFYLTTWSQILSQVNWPLWISEVCAATN